MRTEAPAFLRGAFQALRLIAAWAIMCWIAPAIAGNIEAVLAPGEVIGAHSKWEQQCDACHVRFNPKGQDQRCMNCHKDVGQDVRQQQGFHGRAKQAANCRSCHTDHKGRQAKIVQLDTRQFNHRQTDMPLQGKHTDLVCDKCHAAGKKFRQAPTACLSCHRADDIHLGGILDKSGAIARCSDCHNESNWKDTRFDHGKQTRFPLEDKHAKVACKGCHDKGRYRDTRQACVDCHQKDDDHKGLRGNKCDSCHDANSWKTSTFNHDQDTRYTLRGQHRKASCTNCHTGHVYNVKLSQDCYACHKQDDKHKETLGRDCQSCHSEAGWKSSQRFDHEQTSFPLLGQHAKAECKDCHKSQLFKEAPKDCWSCHKQDDKHQGSLGTTCADCHNERGWRSTAGRFDHGATQFPLRNAHAAAKVQCKDCHAQGLTGFRGTDTSCHACHQKDDKHEGSQGKQCDNCHSDISWRSTQFDHGKTRFPLTGRHNGVECRSCHETKRFRGTARECVACHQKNDVHRAALGERCEACHNTRHWLAWDFNHNRKTNYPLTGAHVRVACAACHTSPAPKGQAISPIGQRCHDCHAKDDAHDGQFGRRCEQCHGTVSWLQPEKTLSQFSGGLPRLKSSAAESPGWSSHFMRNQPLPGAAPPTHDRQIEVEPLAHDRHDDRGVAVVRLHALGMGAGWQHHPG